MCFVLPIKAYQSGKDHLFLRDCFSLLQPPNPLALFLLRSLPFYTLTHVCLRKEKKKNRAITKAVFLQANRGLHGRAWVDRVGWWSGKENEGFGEKIQGLNQITSVGPSDEAAVGCRCLSTFKTKIPNVVLCLEHVRCVTKMHSVCVRACARVCVCARVCIYARAWSV